MSYKNLVVYADKQFLKSTGIIIRKLRLRHLLVHNPYTLLHNFADKKKSLITTT